MGLEEYVKRPRFRCDKCGHTWVARSMDPPGTCPGCNNPNWNQDA